MPKKQIQHTITPEEIIINKIFFIRGKKIMLDRDLAELYGVPTKVLKQSVKRNSERFPDDFMFELSKEEFKNLRSQIVTSSWGGARYNPYAFTEQGVAMLSSVLNSKQAIAVNIQIIRVFTRIREMLSTHKDILLKLEMLEKKLMHQDERSKKNEEEIQMIFNYLKELLNPVKTTRKKIGYKHY